MSRIAAHGFLTLTTVLILAMTIGATDMAELQPDQILGGFSTEALYENERGDVMGARFRHVKSGFLLDLLRIQSVPQAFMWVNSPPPSDQGEPHTLEHLLLGKGTKGRYVASLEDMSLGSSSAFTMQMRTCYHFHTSAGSEVFFNLFEEKLDAMLHPNFSDEEIRREVCNIGLRVDPVDSSLSLEEKGTVYNEMVSSFERPWGDLYFELGRMLYGMNHPYAYSAGGFPAAIRTMTPEDIREFHAATHHLYNMGAVVSIPREIAAEDCLRTLDAILTTIEPDAEPRDHPDDYDKQIPAPNPAEFGALKQVTFPHQNENESGLMVIAWPPTRELSPEQFLLLDLMLDNLASGQTSNLFDRFINSQTRIMDIGANSLFGWLDTDPGNPVYIGLNQVRADATTTEVMDSVRAIILAEIETVAGWPADAEALADFNERALNRIESNRKSLRNMLNSPPRFGYRGTGSNWMNHLKRLHDIGGFRRSLVLEDQYAAVEEQIRSGRNIWQPLIAQARLLKEEPFVVSTRPDPDRIEQSEEARSERLDNFAADLMTRYGVVERAEAVRLYQEDYNKKTAVIDAEAATIKLPAFLENPPLSLDEQLDYRVETLPGGGDLVVSTFENMTSATMGLAFDMYSVPESLLVYVSVLPSLLTESGIIRDGQVVPYNEMEEQLRREILRLDTYYSTNHRTGRVELVARAAGSNPEETRKATHWLADAINNTYLQPANLPRLRDVVDLRLGNARNRMRGSEESWVNEPAYAYWKQHNPLLLNADCFLTQEHALHRIRWQLKAAGDSPEAFVRFMQELATLADASNRDALLQALTDVTAAESTTPAAVAYREAHESDQSLMSDALKDLKVLLGGIPDETLADDWRYLCAQIVNDLAVHPSDALVRIQTVLDHIRRQPNVRGFVIANPEDQGVILPALDEIVGALNTESVERDRYTMKPYIEARLASRYGPDTSPIFVGLVNEATRAGVHINTSDCAGYDTRNSQQLLRFLSARLYGGGGAHSMFMKTWGAGLAYSNGLRSSAERGRIIYYAERCPDLAQTMQFVVNELEKAPFDTTLAQYAVAQAFSGNRSGSRYESRGEAMAADLADGLTPDVVAGFRESILKLRDMPEFYDTLHNLMPATYGEILPGYGVDGHSAAANSNAFYFVIGPEKQLSSYESYLKSAEGTEVMLYRIHPRDFWITEDVSLN